MFCFHFHFKLKRSVTQNYHSAQKNIECAFFLFPYHTYIFQRISNSCMNSYMKISRDFQSTHKTLTHASFHCILKMSTCSQDSYYPTPHSHMRKLRLNEVKVLKLLKEKPDFKGIHFPPSPALLHTPHCEQSMTRGNAISHQRGMSGERSHTIQVKRNSKPETSPTVV